MKVWQTMMWISVSVAALGAMGCNVFVGERERRERVIVEQRPVYVQERPVIVERPVLVEERPRTEVIIRGR